MRIPIPPRDSSALSLQVAAVREVLGFGQQPAALRCQSRCSQGGDGGGSQQSGDLQGTWGSRGDRWGGGTLTSQASSKACSLSSYPVLHPLVTPLPVINTPLAGPHAQTQPGGSGWCSPAKQDVPSSPIPILHIPLEPESILFPGNPSWQKPASSAPSKPIPDTETCGKCRRMPSPRVPPSHVTPHHPSGA